MAYSVRKVFSRIMGTAGETLAAGEAVTFKDADGLAYQADADTATIRPALGVIGSKSGATGATVEIVTAGIMTGWSSLAEGGPVYLSETVGDFTQAAPAYRQPVGVAVSATDILFNFGASPISTGGTVASAADALAIPVTHAVVTKTTGSDAEALTLADGVAGQSLTITLVVDGGGTGTLTPTTATGFATIVFADAGDTATLLFVDATVGWVITGTTGVAAPPVITI